MGGPTQEAPSQDSPRWEAAEGGYAGARGGSSSLAIQQRDPGELAAISLQPGDIIVGDQLADAIIRVNPANGFQTVISSGGLIQNPFGIQIDQNGQIIISDTLGGLYRIDPATGTQSAIPNTVMHLTRSLVLDGNGHSAKRSRDGNPADGVLRRAAKQVTGLVITPDGIIAATGNRFAPLPKGVYLIDPVSGAQTMLSTGGLVGDPFGIVFDPVAREYLVVERGGARILRVNASTGAQALVSSGQFFQAPISIAIVPAVGIPSGRVPEGGLLPGDPLQVGLDGGEDLTLTWGVSCVNTDDDFAVYEGSLGNFTSHVPVVCSTGGNSGITLAPTDGNSYYLVVPRGPTHEGSYGRDSNGNERSQGDSACVFQMVADCP